MDGFYRPPGTPKGPNCGVTATATFAQCTFQEAEAAVDVARREQGHTGANWKGMTNHKMVLRALRLLAVDFEEVRVNYREQLRNWARYETRIGKWYLVWTSGHVQVVKDCHVVDQTTPLPCPINQFWGRNKIVRKVLMLNEPEEVEIEL